MKRSVAAALLVFVAVALGAETAPTPATSTAPVPPPDPAAAAAAMEKLAFLIGRWEGEGATRFGPGEPTRSQVVEVAQSKIGGHAVLLEGLGTVAGPDGGAPRVVHQALGVLSYDLYAREYRMRAITAERGTVDADIEVGDRRLVWSFATPQGRVRFTMTLDEQGRWYEIGEYSRDGASWRSFFEMTLRRVGDV
jgi:hypothetical protein